jgi:hypothetical protein
MWRYNDVILPNPLKTYYLWYVLLEMNFSLYLTYCSEKSILSKQINDSINVYTSNLIQHIFMWLGPVVVVVVW